MKMLYSWRRNNLERQAINVIYPFMTLDDGTEIVHSEMKDDGSVKVYIEKADAVDGFHNITCWLPRYEWKDNYGFKAEEIDRFKEIVQSTAHLIMRFAKEGGLEHAASF